MENTVETVAMVVKTLISINTPTEDTTNYVFEANGAKAPQSPRTVHNEKHSLFTYLGECV